VCWSRMCDALEFRAARRPRPCTRPRLTSLSPPLFNPSLHTQQTIMLLLGGFAIAAALSKHFIAKQLAVSILSRVGRRPRDVILANMLVATFASMWISNVAAPVLCFRWAGLCAVVVCVLGGESLAVLQHPCAHTPRCQPHSTHTQMQFGAAHPAHAADQPSLLQGACHR
jgi:di/tricarboxylate transporter